MYYEVSFLTQNINLEERKDLFKKIEEKLKELGGKIEDKFIEKKVFAYPVKKQEEGFLGHISFFLEPAKIRRFQDFLKTNKEIVREMTERKKKIPEVRRERRISPRKPRKKEKVKIEELDKKLGEILK